MTDIAQETSSPRAGAVRGEPVGVAPIPISGSVWSRVAWFVLFAIPTAVMITAASLTPSPLGHGTHTQLGLPPCGFLVVTGVPCPGCGLTTSFTNMIRLNVVDAAAANPFGVMLFLVTFAFIPVAGLGLVRGWSVIDTLDRLQFEKWAILLAVCSILTWVVRIVAHYTA